MLPECDLPQILQTHARQILVAVYKKVGPENRRSESLGAFMQTFDAVEDIHPASVRILQVHCITDVHIGCAVQQSDRPSIGVLRGGSTAWQLYSGNG